MKLDAVWKVGPKCYRGCLEHPLEPVNIAFPQDGGFKRVKTDSFCSESSSEYRCMRFRRLDRVAPSEWNLALNQECVLIPVVSVALFSFRLANINLAAFQHPGAFPSL